MTVTLLTIYACIFLGALHRFAAWTKDDRVTLAQTVVCVLFAAMWPLWILAVVAFWVIGVIITRKPMEPP